jgi:hypothetical protein
MKCPDDSCLRRNDKGDCAVLPEAAEVGEKSIKSAGGLRAKIHFFKIFSISFRISVYKFIQSEKPAFFDQMRKFALLRGTPALWDAPLAIPSGSFFARYEMLYMTYSIRNTQYDIRITQYEIQSIKTTKLCKTNPISKMSKWL